MRIEINGVERTLPEGLSVLEPEQAAVELNRVLVPRAKRAEVNLNEGDRVEIVTLVGGG